MRVVLLAGGHGTRLAEMTDVVPKPMIEIGGRPILWHIMSMYSTYGFSDFLVALGSKGEVVKDYFLNYHRRYSDLSISLATGHVEVHGSRVEDWKIQLVDTGLETGTGGRLKCLSPLLSTQTFMMTYGDGVANIDIRRLVEFHREHGKLATVTAVRPPARFGELILSGDVVTTFTEKPWLGEGWINGGFLVLEPGVLDYIENDGIMFERQPLATLANDGQLVAYRHDDFWQGVDTLRDLRFLRQLWEEEKAPWKVWEA